MSFYDEIKSLSNSIPEIKKNIKNEQTTKISLIQPLIQKLGYNIFDPTEFVAEYDANVGSYKSEKIDYAIVVEDNPIILIECKSCTTSLNDKHQSQLYHYFATKTAKFGILTNGLIYKFYTDLEEKNKMDQTPFLEINMENPSDIDIYELERFSKTRFNEHEIRDVAGRLKYSSDIRKVLDSEYRSPSADFVHFILKKVYKGVKTQKVVDRFTPMIKKEYDAWINDIIREKIDPKSPPIPEPKIITTEEELNAFYIVRGLLCEVVPIEDVTFKDTMYYFGILYKNNTWKSICRIKLDAQRKQLFIPQANKDWEKIFIESLNDLYQYKNKLIEVVKRYL